MAKIPPDRARTLIETRDNKMMEWIARGVAIRMGGAAYIAEYAMSGEENVELAEGYWTLLSDPELAAGDFIVDKPILVIVRVYDVNAEVSVLRADGGGCQSRQACKPEK